MPWRSPASMPSMTCTEWATVTAISTNSAAAISPKNFMPVQPVKPTPDPSTAASISTMAAVPHTERSRTTAASSIVASTMGARIPVSSSIASRMARLRTSSPVRW